MIFKKDNCLIYQYDNETVQIDVYKRQVLDNHQKYAGNQLIQHCGYFPPPDCTGTYVQSDGKKGIQEVFSGIHLSSPLYFHSGYAVSYTHL